MPAWLRNVLVIILTALAAVYAANWVFSHTPGDWKWLALAVPLIVTPLGVLLLKHR